MLSLLRRFLNANIAVSKKVERLFPQCKAKLEAQFQEELRHCLETEGGNMVLDVGAGRSSRLLSLLSKRHGIKVIAVDVSCDELALNSEATFKVCADASQGLPFAPNTAAVVTSRFLIEHLEDTERFIGETARVAASPGMVFHLVAAPYTPFAILGRLLPVEWTQKVIARVYPAQVGILGYPVHYKHCSFKLFTKLLKKYGFTIQKTACSYHQSAYLYACFPLFFLSACYDACIYMLGLRILCAAFYVRAAAPRP